MQEDLRIIKTKEKIYHALAKLMKRSSFDKITVSDIVRESGITRKTFYNHYQDKFEIVYTYQAEIMEYMLHNFVNPENIDEVTLLHFARYINKQSYILSVLLSKNGSIELQNSFRDVMKQYYMKSFSKDISNQIELEYKSTFYAGALFSIIQHWITSKKRISPKKLTETISKLSLL